MTGGSIEAPTVAPVFSKNKSLQHCGVTRLESLYTSVAYLYPGYRCQVEFSKNIFLTLSGWLCSLFICVYFFLQVSKLQLLFKIQLNSQIPTVPSPLHYILCCERSEERSSFLVSFFPAPPSRFLVFSLYPQNPVTMAGCRLIHHCQLPHSCRVDGWLDCECDSAVCV